MSNTDKTSSTRTNIVRGKTLAVYHKLNPTKNEGGDFFITRVVGQVTSQCCTVPCSPPGAITGFSAQYGYPAPSPYDTDYEVYYNLSWDPVADAISYTVTSNGAGDLVVHPTSTSTTATIYLPTGDYDNRIFTLRATTRCGSVDTSEEVFPCFLAGTPVQMADGTIKAIEDICVNDLVLGAFGEINTVLALHRPLLGSALMCKINDEHSTTNHHPHISLNRQFYCGNPELVSQLTYGHFHKVIDAEGTIVERMLHGLKKERIQKLSLGVELKTVEGSRIVTSIETYTMPEDTQLYNLVVSGSHTYHVDGYAVTGWPREDDFDYDNWIQI
jgi:hypothetical protein